MQKTNELCRDGRGAGFVEYLVLVGAIALAGVAGFTWIGSSLFRKGNQQEEQISLLEVPIADRKLAAQTDQVEPHQEQRGHDHQASAGPAAGQDWASSGSTGPGSGRDFAEPSPVAGQPVVGHTAESADAPNGDEEGSFAISTPTAGIVGALLGASVAFVLYLRARQHVKEAEESKDADESNEVHVSSTEAQTPANHSLAAVGCGAAAGRARVGGRLPARNRTVSARHHRPFSRSK